MSYENDIINLKKQVNNLAETIMQIARNASSEVEKRENTTNQVNALTPYTDTKTAYIGDTNVVFNGVKDGNLTVFVEDNNGDYPDFLVKRSNDSIMVEFAEPLEYVTNITISIQ